MYKAAKSNTEHVELGHGALTSVLFIAICGYCFFCSDFYIKTVICRSIPVHFIISDSRLFGWPSIDGLLHANTKHRKSMFGNTVARRETAHTSPFATVVSL